MKVRKHIAAVSLNFKRGDEERKGEMKDSHTREVCVEKSNTIHLKQGSTITCPDIAERLFPCSLCKQIRIILYT